MPTRQMVNKGRIGLPTEMVFREASRVTKTGPMVRTGLPTKMVFREANEVISMDRMISKDRGLPTVMVIRGTTTQLTIGTILFVRGAID